MANFKEWRSQYPAGVVLEMGRCAARGTCGSWRGRSGTTTGLPQPAVNILEFRGDRVARETIYVTEPWDAPEWRARWRAAP